MKTRTTFSRHYCAGMAAMAMTMAAVGLATTGERYSGLPGAWEIALLLVAAALVVASDLTVSRAGPAVTLTLAGAALVVVGWLVFLNLVAPTVGSVITLETVAVFLVVVYLTQLPRD